MGLVEVDYKDVAGFVRTLQAAEPEVLTAERDTIKYIADEFLDAVVEKILEEGNFDTGRLADSFHEGNAAGVYLILDGGMELEVGTNVEYADWVNTGHHQTHRFVPGSWSEDVFIYDPGAYPGGMALKAKWVEGSHYYDNTLSAYRGAFPGAAGKYFDALVKEVFRV
jgi:hypothetical protein